LGELWEDESGLRRREPLMQCDFFPLASYAVGLLDLDGPRRADSPKWDAVSNIYPNLHSGTDC